MWIVCPDFYGGTNVIAAVDNSQPVDASIRAITPDTSHCRDVVDGWSLIRFGFVCRMFRLGVNWPVSGVHVDFSNVGEVISLFAKPDRLSNAGLE